MTHFQYFFFLGSELVGKDTQKDFFGLRQILENSRFSVRKPAATLPIMQLELRLENPTLLFLLTDIVAQIICLNKHGKIWIVNFQEFFDLYNIDYIDNLHKIPECSVQVVL